MKLEIRDFEEKMKKCLAATEREFSSVRAGRANATILDRISVDYYGTPTRLRDLAGISTPEPRLLVVQPWDKGSLAAIEKAILSSNVGITPMNDGKLLRLPVPELSQERRAALSKQAKAETEDAKVALRNIRRDANEIAKKAQKDSEITEDDLKKMLDDIQKTTDRYIAALDAALAVKEKELMTV